MASSLLLAVLEAECPRVCEILSVYMRDNEDALDAELQPYNFFTAANEKRIAERAGLVLRIGTYTAVQAAWVL